MVFGKLLMAMVLIAIPACKLDSPSSTLNEEVASDKNEVEPQVLYQCVAESGLWGKPDVAITFPNGKYKSHYGFFSNQDDHAESNGVFIMPEGVFQLNQSVTKIFATLTKRNKSQNGLEDPWIHVMFKNSTDGAAIYAGDFNLVRFGSEEGFGQFARVVPRENPVGQNKLKPLEVVAVKIPSKHKTYQNLTGRIQAGVKLHVENIDDEVLQTTNMELYSAEYEQLQDKFSEAAVEGDAEALEAAEQEIFQVLHRPLDSVAQKKKAEQVRKQLFARFQSWTNTCKGLIPKELKEDVQKLDK